MHCDCACCNLLFERLISAEQQLLSRLTSRIKCSRNLHAAKGPIVKKPAILPGKRHALGDTLVDDIETDLRKPIDVGFTSAIVAAFDRVFEQTEDAVAVVAIILGGINS